MVRRREDGRKGARAVALYGLLIALAFIFSYVEAMIPVPVPIPGVKLGLANLVNVVGLYTCLLYTSPSPRDRSLSRMPSSA